MLYLFWMTVPLAIWDAMTRPAPIPAKQAVPRPRRED